MKLTGKCSRNRNFRASSIRQRKQQHVLDVRMRPKRTQQLRLWKGYRAFLKTTMFVVAIAGLIYSFNALINLLFLENPAYAITQINVQTDGTLTRQQILEKSGIKEGNNLFRTNLAEVHSRLARLTQVESVEVRRLFPNQIAMKITERVPIAWVVPRIKPENASKASRLYMVDSSGVLLEVEAMIPHYVSLPIIKGAEIDQIELGKPIVEPGLKSALQLLDLYNKKMMHTYFNIESIDLSKGYSMLAIDSNYTEILFARNYISKQLDRLEELFQHCNKIGRQPAAINLIVERNMPVILRRPGQEIIRQAAAQESHNTLSFEPEANLKLTPSASRERIRN